ncbi:hypothetical protein C0J52_13432 [Blattella germanica]|nr:hypothetical protein C0J52_13432 [Blattella germanica]
MFNIFLRLNTNLRNNKTPILECLLHHIVDDVIILYDNGAPHKAILFRDMLGRFKMKSMHIAMVLILLTSCLYTASCQRRKKSNKKRWEDNFNKSNSFGCKHPQPRVVSIEDIHMTNPELLYTPHVTVLDRCMNDSGCCADASHVCQSVEDKRVPVELVFHVTNQFKDEQDPKIIRLVFILLVAKRKIAIIHGLVYLSVLDKSKTG